jgi:hypothetical protein
MRDHNGQQLAYVYFEDEPGRRSAAKLLSKDEARRIAAPHHSAQTISEVSWKNRKRIVAQDGTLDRRHDHCR